MNRELALAKMTEPLDIVGSWPLAEGARPSVRDMVRNHTVDRAVSDASWGEFRSMLEYKAAWYGREMIAVDHWFPSSKLRSACGTFAQKMPPHVRTRTCGGGTTHDRDVNAAKNPLAAGLAVTFCGAGVGPQRRPPDGQSARKQKPHGASCRNPLVHEREEVRFPSEPAGSRASEHPPHRCRRGRPGPPE